MRILWSRKFLIASQGDGPMGQRHLREMPPCSGVDRAHCRKFIGPAYHRLRQDVLLGNIRSINHLVHRPKSSVY